MFEQNRLINLFQSLAPAQQSEVINFMEFLRQKQERNPQLQSAGQAWQPLRFGCMKGLVEYIADDFDEPLEDFAEYM